MFVLWICTIGAFLFFFELPLSSFADPCVYTFYLDFVYTLSLNKKWSCALTQFNFRHNPRGEKYKFKIVICFQTQLKLSLVCVMSFLLLLCCLLHAYIIHGMMAKSVKRSGDH